MINISTSSACIFQKQITRNVILKSYQLSRENVNHLTIDTSQITLGINLICIISLPQNFFDSSTMKLLLSVNQYSIPKPNPKQKMA